jgi:hypothetical protein
MHGEMKVTVMNDKNRAAAPRVVAAGHFYTRFGACTSNFC